MNVLYINHTSRFSGAEVDLLELIQATKADFRPLVVCPPGGRLVVKLRERDIEAKLIPMPEIVRSANPMQWGRILAVWLHTTVVLSRLLRSRSINLVHCNSSRAALLAWLPNFLLRRPLIWHMHDILSNRRSNSVFARVLAWRAEKIICVSEAVRDNLVGLAVPAEKCVVIHNAMYSQKDLAREVSPGAVRSSLPDESRNAPLVGIIGQVAEWKGQREFLMAARRVIAQIPSAIFLVVGDTVSDRQTAYALQLRQLASDLGIAQRTIFTGFREDVHSVMAELDVLVHASIRPDPFPLVLIEAMSLAKPVVASRIGGVPELVEDGGTGFLVEPRSYDQMADAICRLLCDSRLARRMGKAARQRVADMIEAEANLAKVKSLYAGLMRE